MKSLSSCAAVCAALAGLWLAGCAKKPPAEETTVPKPPEVVQAPAGKHVHEEGGLMSKVPEEAEAVPNLTTADAASLEHGKKLYSANCVPCHGDKGDGKGPLGIGLTPPPGDFTDKEMMADHTDGALFWAITNGGGPMPRFSKKLSDEERWHLVNYIRTFSG